MFIYLPFTADILTPGHIKTIELARTHGFVVIGLLTDAALRGNRKTLVPYEDRLFIMEYIAKAIGNTMVVPQIRLDPTENIKFYECTTIASGKEFSPEEQDAIKSLKLDTLEIRLKGERKGAKNKTYSSAKIKEKLAQ